MEFKSLKNIESNFRLIRICCALFAGLCAAVAVASVGFSYASVSYTHLTLPTTSRV